MFAAVNGNIIQLYSTTTFENPINLKGHNGKVRAVVWSADDSKVCTGHFVAENLRVYSFSSTLSKLLV